MSWLDVETPILDRLTDLGYTTTRTETDLQQRVATSGAVIRVHRSGGIDRRWFVTARIIVDVYAASRETAWQVAEAATVRLTRTSFKADGTVIDLVVGEVANAEVAYPDSNLRLVTSTFRVTARRTTAQLAS